MNREGAVDLVPHAARWRTDFAAVRKELARCFEEASVAIEHIGSTAVPGLAAKPVIDVLVGAPSLAAIEDAIDELEAYGYHYEPRYESELPQRRYFTRAAGQRPAVHVHAVVQGSPFWQDHIAFRDALLGDAELASRYEALKKQLAAQHRLDRGAYTDGKSTFIKSAIAAHRHAAGLQSGDVPPTLAAQEKTP